MITIILLFVWIDDHRAQGRYGEKTKRPTFADDHGHM